MISQKMPENMNLTYCVIEESLEKSLENQRSLLIGKILWTLHKEQGTQVWLIQAIEPYLEKEDRLLFGLV